MSRDQMLDQSPDQQIGMRWPAAVDARFESLRARAVAAGERTSRKELLAALILDADYDGQELRAIVHNYRMAQVSDALLESSDGADVVLLPRQRPGPRGRAS